MEKTQVTFMCDYCQTVVVLDKDQERSTAIPANWFEFNFEGRTTTGSYISVEGHICPSCMLAHEPTSEHLLKQFYPALKKKKVVVRKRSPKKVVTSTYKRPKRAHGAAAKKLNADLD